MSNLSTQQLRILIADDVRAMRHSTSIMLKSLVTATVSEATTGLEAVKLARELKPNIAIVDIQMDGVDGPGAIRAMLAMNSALKCIAMSTEHQPEMIARAKNAGACEFLLKPFTLEELKGALETALTPSLDLRKPEKHTAQLRNKRDEHLQQLADGYIKSKCYDKNALQVFEELARNPYCEFRWLRYLAIIYALNNQWRSLSSLAARIDEQYSGD